MEARKVIQIGDILGFKAPWHQSEYGMTAVVVGLAKSWVNLETATGRPVQWPLTKVLMATYEVDPDDMPYDPYIDPNYDGPGDGDEWSGPIAKNH